MGQGRNAVFLAMKGWDVTGFDISDEGIAVARKNAERAGVKINAVRETDEAFDYGSSQWDLIVFVYNPLPVTTAAYVERLRKSLKAGGIIVIEGPGAEVTQAARASTAIDPGHLLAAFKDFRLLYYQDTIAKSDWPVVGEDKTRIVRMVVENRP
jgi:2-polyprenyl-3-methyl-5-hydroxy-6-metoxy-1,4-benzoquinol methylase